MHILVADDDAVSRTAIRECLAEYRGLDIHDAASGEEAWEWLRNPDAPVLCLLDVRMPDLDGVGLMRRMREDMRFCQVPVMLITSNAQKEVVMEAAQLGLGGIVIKPVDPEQTKARILPVLRTFLETLLQKPEKVRQAQNFSEERYLRTLAAFFSQLDQVVEELDGMKGKGKQTLPLFEAKLETLKQNAVTLGSSYLRQVLDRVHKRVGLEGDPDGMGKRTVAQAKSLLRDYVTWLDLPVSRYETARSAAGVQTG